MQKKSSRFDSRFPLEVAKKAQTPEPKRFLQTLVQVPKNTITVAEEIYHEADQTFYESFQKRDSSEKPLSYNNTKPLTRMSEVKTSPIDKRRLTPVGTSFPVMSNFNRKLTITSQSNRDSKKNIFGAINKVIEACENTGKNDLSSVTLEKTIGKDRKIALRYVQDISWTCNKLNEYNQYHSELIKTLYQESAMSYKVAEEDKTAAYRTFTSKSLQDYKAKAKGIKQVLHKYKERIFH